MLKVYHKTPGKITGDEVEMKDTYEDVEEVFRELVKYDPDIFRDRTSLELMKAIDGAERLGEYGVVTPLGKSCITCLSSGCKAGLLILYYNSRKIVPDVKSGIAGENVWKWLHENAEAEVMAGTNSLVYLKTYIGEETMYWWDLSFEEQDERRRMTPEKERVAYGEYVRENGDPSLKISTGLSETLPFTEYLKRFEKYQWVLDWNDDEPEEQVPMDYTIINRIPAMDEKASCRKLPVFRFWTQDGKPVMTRDLTCKHPDIPEIIFPEFMSSFYNYEQDRYIRFDEMDGGRMTAIVLDVDEVFDPFDYTYYVWFAVEADARAKTLTLYDREEAIVMFHEKMQMFAEEVSDDGNE